MPQTTINLLQGSLNPNFTLQFLTMTQPKSFLNQQVKIIQTSKSLDVQLSFKDVMKDLTCSKQEIARRFKLIIQQKEGLLRKNIDQINNNNLRIMQEKSVYFQEVNKTNKMLNQQLCSKKAQIISLQQKIVEFTQRNQQINSLLKQTQIKHKDFQDWALSQHKRLQIIQLQYKKLSQQIEQQKHRKNQLQRSVDTMKNQTINWGDRIKYLLQNRQMGLKNQYQEQINKLKDILFYYQHNYRMIKLEQAKQLEKFNQAKQVYEISIKNIKHKYSLESVPILNHAGVQTQSNTIKRIDVSTQIQADCKQCKKIRNVAHHLLTKNVSIQTDKDPRKFTQCQSQTVFKFMTTQQERKLICEVRNALEICQKRRNILQSKIQQLQHLVQAQPSKMDDLVNIGKLQTVISHKDRTNQLLKNQNLSMRNLNRILHHQIQCLKLQINQKQQVRIDSLQFQMHKNTARMITETPYLEQKIIQTDFTMTNPDQIQRKFSKTIDFNTHRLKLSTGMGMTRAATSSSFPLKPKTAKSVNLKNTFYTQDPQTQRWHNFQKKLKNPQLFSPSPIVNAVRRQQYKKFSSLKKRPNNYHDKQINFTVAF